MDNTTTQAKSRGSGRLLIRLLRLNVGLSALSLLLSAIQLALPGLYAGLKFIDGLQSLLGGLVLLIVIVLFGVWIFKLHRDLAVRFSEYSTSPRRALAQCFIPIYNIWGLPQTFRTLAKRLKLENDPVVLDVGALEKWTQWLAASIAASIVVNTISRSFLNGTAFNEALSYVLTTAVGLVQAVIWLRLAEIVSRIVEVKSDIAASTIAAIQSAPGPAQEIPPQSAPKALNAAITPPPLP